MGYFTAIIILTVVSESKIWVLVFPFQVSVPAVPSTAEMSLNAEFIISLGENFQGPLSAGVTQAHREKINGRKSPEISGWNLPTHMQSWDQKRKKIPKRGSVTCNLMLQKPNVSLITPHSLMTIHYSASGNCLSSSENHGVIPAAVSWTSVSVL